MSQETHASENLNSQRPLQDSSLPHLRMSYNLGAGLIRAVLNHVLMVPASPGNRPHHPFAPAPGAGATPYHLQTAMLGIPNKAFLGPRHDL